MQIPSSPTPAALPEADAPTRRPRFRNPRATRAAALLAAALLAGSWSARAAENIILGTAGNFAVLGATTVTNTGPTQIIGDLGVNPGNAITGFPPGVVIGVIHSADAAASLAQANANTAYLQLAAEARTSNLTGINLGGLTLTPGVYHFDNLAQLNGTLTLNTAGNPNAAFHFQIGSALTLGPNSAVVLQGLNGGSDQNIFWQVGSSATLGTGADFLGTVIASMSVTLNTGADIVSGRAIALNGAVTLDTNTISNVVIPNPTGSIWNGGASNLWSGANWSPTLSGAVSTTLAPAADVVFSVTGVAPQNQSTVLDFDATISSLTVNDPAPVTISGPHTLTIVGGGASSGITINRGAGRTTIDSNLLLSGPSRVMTVNNAAGLVINGVVGGATGLTKAGVGQLTLNGANAYTGMTTVGAGTLEVNGSILGSALVSGGTLRGVGRIGGGIVNQAAVNPGRASGPGNLSAGGNFTQAPSGSLNLRLASPTSYDTLRIGGAAMLGGALNVSYLDGFNAQPGDVFDVLTAAGGVSGRFASFHDEHATGTILTLGVVYERNHVLLEFEQGSFAALSPAGGLTPNQKAVARALDKLASGHPDNALIARLDLLQLAELPGALNLLSPEDFAAIFTAGLAVSQVQAGNIERRLTEVRQGNSGFSDSGFAVSDARGAQNFDGKSLVDRDSKSGKEFLAPARESDPRWGFFISGTGEWGDLESTSRARGSSFTTGGVTIGADFRVNRHLVVGAAIGYANTSSDLSRGGSLDIDSGKGSLYATFYNEGFYLNGIVGAGYGSYESRRRTFGGVARGDTEGTDFSGLLGTGYDFHLGAFTFGPIASIQYGTLAIDSFSERGAVGALRIDSQSQDSLKSAIGLRAAYTKKVGRVLLIPEVRAQWQHEYLTRESSIDAGFGSGSSFTVHGPATGRDALLLEAGVSAQISARLAIFASYTGELGRENYTAHSVNGGIRIGF